MSLHAQLQDALAHSLSRFPPEALEIIEKSNAEIQAMNIAQTARSVGDWLPDVALTQVDGTQASLRDLCETGPFVLTFYRGGWCPYCNLELKAYQDLLGEITAAGGHLIAITPEKPDNSLSTIEKNALSFPVLTDVGNAFAKAMGIAFELPAGLQALFQNFGMNMPELNAGTGWALPVPATFVVDGADKIVLAHVESDYTCRLEPSEAVAALKSCVHAIR